MSDTAVDRRSHESSARSAESNKLGVGYAVYEPVGQKTGSAEEAFVNRDGEPVYDRVRTVSRDEVCADPGAVRRDRRDEKSARPEVGGSCLRPDQ